MPADDHLEILDIDAADIARHPDAVDRILSRNLFGVVVRGVFHPDELAQVIRSIEQNDLLPCFEADTFRGRTYGRVLRMANDRLDEYFEAAQRVSPGLAAAFSHAPSTYEIRLREIVGALGGGRPVTVPFVGDRGYNPATVRVLDPGGTIFLHCGNETHSFPALGELTTIIDPAGEISTLMPLAFPESGGELEIYDVCHGDPLIDELDKELGREHAHQGLATRLFRGLKPRVGDLALFEEGRRYHRVSEVVGSRSRWTIGGFLAPSRDGGTLHYWS